MKDKPMRYIEYANDLTGFKNPITSVKHIRKVLGFRKTTEGECKDGKNTFWVGVEYVIGMKRIEI
jgi:hypothetical protein